MQTLILYNTSSDVRTVYASHTIREYEPGIQRKSGLLKIEKE